MFDSQMGYNELAVSPESQEKIEFQGVVAVKWTYAVMRFGPTNRPATFINFIHDIYSFGRSLPNRTAYRSTMI